LPGWAWSALSDIVASVYLNDRPLEELWQQLQNRHNDRAPMDVLRVVASLCGGRAPDALYCMSEELEGRTVWRVLAVVHASLVEAQVTGPDNPWTQQTGGEGAREVKARVTRLNDEVQAVRVRSVWSLAVRQGVGAMPSPWVVSWSLDLKTSGEFLLPGAADASSPRQLESAERLAQVIVRHLQVP
jgi:hypothetical protein